MKQHIIVNSQTIDVLAVMMLIATILHISTGRLTTCVWAYAFRSFILACASGIIAYLSGIYHIFITTGITLVIKVVIIPWFLFYIIKKSGLKKR